MIRIFLLVFLTAFAGAATAGELHFTTAPADGQPLALAQVFDQNGCAGGNKSPALGWDGVPAEAQSLAVTIFDPDAKQGYGWWHWAAFNLPATLTGLPEGAGAAGASFPQGRAGSGQATYSGACPPFGDPPHHYIITLWALNVPAIALPAGIPDATVQNELVKHVLAKAIATPVYSR